MTDDRPKAQRGLRLAQGPSYQRAWNADTVCSVRECLMPSEAPRRYLPPEKQRCPGLTGQDHFPSEYGRSRRALTDLGPPQKEPGCQAGAGGGQSHTVVWTLLGSAMALLPSQWSPVSCHSIRILTGPLPRASHAPSSGDCGRRRREGMAPILRDLHSSGIMTGTAVTTPTATAGTILALTQHYCVRSLVRSVPCTSHLVPV